MTPPAGAGRTGTVAISSDGTATFPGEYRPVFDAVCAAAAAERMKIVGADPVTGVIKVSSDISAFSWGENGEIRVWQQEPGTIGVGIQSSLKFGLVDWGRNRKNVERLFARIEAVLVAGPPPPPPAGWHPDPTGRHQSRYWDGSAWTPHVSDAGATAVDPIQ